MRAFGHDALSRRMNTSPVSANVDDDAIAEAIDAAEGNTSGEIRVFISRHHCDDPSRAARQEFARLNMTRTPLRNAVLLYLAPRNQAFAVACDESVQFRCGPDFYAAIASAARPHLNSGALQQALLAAVRCAGEHLARHFPRHSLDRDDLPNAVIRD